MSYILDSGDTVSRKTTAPALHLAAPTDSAVDRVTAEVRRRIRNGTMSPGQSFAISDLSDELGVSHIPVREALRQLEAQGLIVLRPGRSAIVSPLDVEELRGIYRLRRALEPDLGARSCNLLGKQGLKRLDDLLEAYADTRADADALWEIHRDLHLTLLTPAASSWDLRILSQLWHASDRYTRIIFDTYQLTGVEREHRIQEHRVIVQAARSGSPFEIRSALDEHLREHEAIILVGIASFK